MKQSVTACCLLSRIMLDSVHSVHTLFSLILHKHLLMLQRDNGVMWGINIMFIFLTQPHV